MILIISGTNRPDSNTKVIASYIHSYLVDYQDEEVRFLSLEDLPENIIHSGMYDEGGQSTALSDIQDKYVIPCQKWILVSPEYNGSFSGILKLFIDALSIRKYDETFAEKKIALVGVSSGRAGNLRGLDQLTQFLQYLKMNVYHDKLPVSGIEDVIGGEGEILDSTQEDLKRMINGFVNFAK